MNRTRQKKQANSPAATPVLVDQQHSADRKAQRETEREQELARLMDLAKKLSSITPSGIRDLCTAAEVLINRHDERFTPGEFLIAGLLEEHSVRGKLSAAEVDAQVSCFHFQFERFLELHNRADKHYFDEFLEARKPSAA